jgi:single-stranded-DNA-specific exonuclease
VPVPSHAPRRLVGVSGAKHSQSKAVSFDLRPVAFADVVGLEQDLGVSHVVAQVLARRGLTDPDAARAFLAADEAHSPRAFRGVGAAVDLVLGHVRRGSVITVHGDYDCDGVCSTAILIGALRELGADVDWYLPDRVADGYGLNANTVERLASRGTALLITADCAITAVDEVAMARSAGMDVLVTDHHAPRGDGVLPDAPIVHPTLNCYPCPHLCATAVAAKFAQALRSGAGLEDVERPEELELVALATVADVVPLVGENRRLVRAGLRALSATGRPGLRALMQVARVDRLRLDEQTLAFRLAPRINAAGRLNRPDAALELLLTDDEARAGELADELDHLNAERRHVETRIRFEAEAQVAATAPAAAYVLAGEGWHPGVIGIVAARIAERHYRPTVLIALPAVGAEGPGVGSARSIPAFDLLAGLDAASEDLLAHGGHRAAAGLQILPEHVESFRCAFVEHAASVLGPEDLVARERADAVADGEDIRLALVEELSALAPFGCANPSVSLLLATATLGETVGFGGAQRSDHARFTVQSGRAKARAVAFGNGGRLPVAPGAVVDAAFSLERNEWQGVVEARLVLRAIAPTAPGPVDVIGEEGDYLDRVFAELDRRFAEDHFDDGGEVRALRDRRGRGVAATIVELASGGELVLVVCAATTERLDHLRGRLGGFALCTYAALLRDPASAAGYPHIVLLDPPASEAESARARLGERGQFTHLAWGAPELRFAVHILQQEYDLRGPLADCYRALRAGDGAAGEVFEGILRGERVLPRSPEVAGRLLRVLTELDLVTLDRPGQAAYLSSSARVALEQSPAYRFYQQRLQDGLQYLEPSKEQVA